MPLRDHFQPPVDLQASWDGFHGQWPAMMVLALGDRLPLGYAAAPHVYLGSSVEIDLGAFDVKERGTAWSPSEEGGGVATAVWAPPRPTLAVASDLPEEDVYEVRVYDQRRGRRLVAAVEIVSPSNKDRPESRRAFVAKCAAMLQGGVCVGIIDLVTARPGNLYLDLLALLGQSDPAFSDAGPEGPPSLYGATCRLARGESGWLLEAWAHPISVGCPLPTLPLWLSGTLAVPLELESSYESTCRALRLV